MRIHGTPAQLEGRRRRALELLDKGVNPSEVAERIGCSRNSVYFWKQLRDEKGEEGLTPLPIPGRPARLTARQKKTLATTLLPGALSHGYQTDLWTTRRIAQVIQKRFGIEYHPNHIWHLLRGLGWSCQKPEKKAREQNQKEVKHWKRYQWPHIKKLSKTWCPSGLPR